MRGLTSLAPEYVFPIKDQAIFFLNKGGCTMRTKTTKTIFFTLFLVMLFTENSSLWWTRRRRRSQPACKPRRCTISWSQWSSCSCPCGSRCTRTRRQIIITEANSCGYCTSLTSDTESCNTDPALCENNSRRIYRGCACRPGWTGYCCGSGEFRPIVGLLMYCFMPPPFWMTILVSC